MPRDLVAELEQRGLVHQTTSAELGTLLAREGMTGYVGFDPTGASLHVGSLLPVLALMRLQRAGHRPIALLGGATGLVGDPSGKQSERSMLDADEVRRNVAGIRAQLERFLDIGGPRGALLVDNAEWLAKTGLLTFLRDVGKHFTVNQMIARESVRPRLQDPDRWISFTEFSYMLLQAYDFLMLFDRYGCTLQMGGSDQWGNIVSGCDLVRRTRGATVHGLTMPLVVRPDGSKFGKTEQGNVWLDPQRTSAFAFYQFWLNTADAEVGRHLRFFTLLPLARIAELEREVHEAPQRRVAQRELAREVTEMVHGRQARERAERTSDVLFGGGDWAELDAEQLEQAFAASPRVELARTALDGPDAAVVAVLVAGKLAPSRNQARQAIQGKGISVNGHPIDAADRVLSSADLLADRYVVLRRGKKAHLVVEVKDRAEGGR